MKNIKIHLKTIGLFLGLALSVPSSAIAQGLPVYDNTNFISMAKSLIESAKQTSELMRTVEFLKEQKDRIEQVSQKIQQLQAVQRLIKNNNRLFGLVQHDLRAILDSPYIKPEEISRVTASFEEILDRSLESVGYIEKVLTSDFLKMSDGERSAVLKEHEASSREMVAEAESKTRRYGEIISFRMMQERINNRETGY